MQKRDLLVGLLNNTRLNTWLSVGGNGKQKVFLERNMSASVGPKIIDHPLYLMLREGNVQSFNLQRSSHIELDFRGCNFRGIDLRGADVAGVDFSDAYFRGADLRGVDFRESRLEGASIAAALISRCYFPDELSPEEITLSLEKGTRLRYTPKP